MSDRGEEECAYIVREVLKYEHEGHDEHQLVVHYPLEGHPVHQEGDGGAAAMYEERGRGQMDWSYKLPAFLHLVLK